MPEPRDEPYLFVSYSRDDAEYVEALVVHMRSQGLRVWYDQLIPNGARWREALADQVEHAAALVLCESPTAQASKWVNEEFLWAEKKKVPLLVLVLDGDLRFGLLTVNATFVTDGSMPGPAFLDRARTLLADVRTPALVSASVPAVSAEAWQFPPVPSDMVARPAQTQAIAVALLHGSGTVAVTGVYGGGGFGKTIAARMVVSRDDVRAAFAGGLLWVELGQERRGPALAATIGELCRRLGGTAAGDAVGVEAAGRAFGALLAARPATLVVLDDVWYPDQLAPFLDVDTGAARFLVTTRMGALLPDDATQVRLDQLDPDQARTVLEYGLPILPTGVEDRLLTLTGGWALAVKAANSALRKAVHDNRDLAATATWLAQTLTSEGPGVLDLGQEHSRGKTIAATLAASLRLLDSAERDRYLELGIFAEDTDIDFATLSLLWGATGHLNLKQARQLAAGLYEQSLVTDYNPVTATLRLHDVVRAYLREQRGVDGVATTHAALLDAAARHYGLPTVDGGLRAWWVLPASADYLWRHLAGHLLGAGRVAELQALLGDLRWFAAKARLVGVADLDADLALAREPSTVESLRRAVRLEGHLLGPIMPNQSHDDIIAARLGTDPQLTNAVAQFRTTLSHDVTRLEPGWPLADAPHNSARRVLTGHTDGVTGVAIAPDGTWLATTSDDNTVRLWDAATGTVKATLTGHTRTVSGVAIAPDGTWLATSSWDNTVRLWDAAAGTVKATLTGHTRTVSGVAIAPDGTWLATSSWDNTVRLWDTAAGTVKTTLTGHTRTVSGVAIAPDGTWLATTSDDNTVRLWDAATGTIKATLAGHANAVTGVAIAPDGTWLATTSDDTVRLWDAAAGTVKATLAGHTSAVTGVAIAPDGTWLATSSWDNTVRLWDTAAGTVKTTLTGHTRTVSGVAIAPDGTWLATTSDDNTVRLWDAATRTAKTTLTGHTRTVTGVAIAPDGTWLATTSDDNTVRLWDAATRTAKATLTGHTDSVTGVAIAPDGTWLATTSDDNTVRLWNAATGTAKATLTGHTSAVTGVAIAPDGTWLATTSDDNTVRLWDAATRTAKTTLTGHTRTVTGVAIAPDGTWLATTSDDNTVRLWDAATRTAKATLTGHTDSVTGVAIAPDGTWLATTSDDNTVRLWNAATGTAKTTLTGHTSAVTGVAIAPDGTWLATTSDDNTVRLWNAATGTAIASMRVSGPLSTVCTTHDAIFCAGASGPFQFDLVRPRQP